MRAAQPLQHLVAADIGQAQQDDVVIVDPRRFEGVLARAGLVPSIPLPRKVVQGLRQLDRASARRTRMNAPHNRLA
jgi:hypothetical protein